MNNNILITGGSGFIGSHLIDEFLCLDMNYHVVNLDALTYAGNLKNNIKAEKKSNYTFVKGDIRNEDLLNQLFEKYNFNGIIHLAAESHVDNSIKDPIGFAETNVLGTLNLLEISKKKWKGTFNNKCFYHISTDEVYGSLSETGFFTEETCYSPRSPYSASKASSDHFVRSYFHTYGLPVKISNCSNNYGPNQYPEKLIPLFIKNIILNKNLPIYGGGENIRDWLYVKDHVEAISLIYHKGKTGSTYNIGGNNEIKNIDLIQILIEKIDNKLGRKKGFSTNLITHVKDRLGHDFRYSIDFSKLKNELGWFPKTSLELGIEKTINWYLKNT
jgi:dTDP-glucose 4,6-dehydratase